MEKQVIAIIVVALTAVVAVIILRKKKHVVAPPVKPPVTSEAAATMMSMAKLAQQGALPSMNGRLINQSNYAGPQLGPEGSQWTVNPNKEYNDIGQEDFQTMGGNQAMMMASRSGSVFSLDPQNQFVGALRM